MENIYLNLIKTLKTFAKFKGEENGVNVYEIPHKFIGLPAMAISGFVVVSDGVFPKNNFMDTTMYHEIVHVKHFKKSTNVAETVEELELEHLIQEMSGDMLPIWREGLAYGIQYREIERRGTPLDIDGVRSHLGTMEKDIKKAYNLTNDEFEKFVEYAIEVYSLPKDMSDDEIIDRHIEKFKRG